MSRILARATALDWERVREQGRTRLHKSPWLITSLQRYLPPEHVALAQRLAGFQATIEGCRTTDAKVDCSNGAAIALDARLDAMRALEGYTQAALYRVGSDGQACTHAIAQSDHLAEAMRRCGYPPGSKGSMRRLVQLTLVHLEAYEDENRDAQTPQMRAGEIRGRVLA